MSTAGLVGVVGTVHTRGVRNPLPITLGSIMVDGAGLAAVAVAAACAAAVCACAPDPRSGRQADAIDVSGPWVEVRADDRGPARVAIVNEGSPNDVEVTITGRFAGADEAALIEALVDDGERAAAGAELILGTGADVLLDEVDGGENVSLDGGASTTLQVVGPAFSATASPEGDDATVRWSLQVTGDGATLAGDLLITFSERRRVVDDSDGGAQRSTRVTVPIGLVRSGL